MSAYSKAVANGRPSTMPLWYVLSKRRYRVSASSATLSRW